jgi:membrane associated rhomboid family serine protease
MLLPYTTDRPPRNPPLAVVSLVLIHFAIFGIVALIMGVRGSDAAVVWYANLSLVPSSIRPHTFLTYAFLHESLFHLSSNMLSLWVFGGSVEDAVGWKRFLALYGTAILAAGILEFAMATFMGRSGNVVPIVGASGAISAVIGVFAFRFYRSSIGFMGLPVRIPAVALLAVVMLVEMGFAIVHLMRRDAAFVSQAAAHWAHVGGFLLGIIWAKSTSAIGHGRLEYLEEDARRAFERGAYPSAAHRWEELYKSRPASLDYRAELAKSYMAMGDRDHALEHFSDTIKGLLKAGDKAKAGMCFLQMDDLANELKLAPGELLTISGSLDELNKPDRAVQVIERILRDHPGASELEIALLRSAALHVKIGNWEAAGKRIREYQERFPSGDLRSYAEDLLRRVRNAPKSREG